MAQYQTSLKDKVPPHNDEAESATLGALLIDSEALSVVLRFLRAGDFYKISHQKIFQGIINLFEKGEVIDLLTLTDELKRQGELEAVGGPAYVSTLTSAVPTSANVEYYARIVQGASIRRNLLRIAGEINASARDDSRESRVIIEETERRIFEITERQQTGTIKTAKEVVLKTIDAIEKLYHTKDSYTGIPSGFPDLDNMTSGFQKSEFIVIGARPSVGKTALAMTMASHMSIKLKIPVGFFTLEMSDMALMQRLLSAEARLDSKRLRAGLLRPADFHHISEAAARIYEAPLFIDDTPNMKLLDLRAQARRMKMQMGVQILFIDYIGLIEPESKGNTPRHEQVAEISRSLKALARELDMPVVTLSQVGRQSEGKAPTLADLRESGSIEQDADVVIFLHRMRESDKDAEQAGQNNIETDLNIAKQRNGPVGSVKIAFLPQYTKFESLASDHE
ncbi:MAG TPA: replicative DNA helicase [Spirochaetia bacterium]|nr:replicative DNA helicase [Spirochaetia bacterium]